MSASRRRSESGAAAVEFAILAPLVFAIVFGALTGAWMWNTKQTLSHGSREAARYGATRSAPLGTGQDVWEPWLQEVADRAIEASVGELNSGQPHRLVCVAYVSDATIQRLVIRDDGESDNGYASGQPCYDDDRPADEARVQVSLRRSNTFIAVFWVRNVPIESNATARHEVGQELPVASPSPS